LYDKSKKDWYLDKLISESYELRNENYFLDTLSTSNFMATPISSFDFETVRELIVEAQPKLQQPAK